MTGKEALEQRIKILEEENKNLKKDINMMCDEKHPYTWRSLMDERNNLRNLYLEKCFKLDEYKRAFEILKDEFGLEIKECCDKYKKAFKKDYQITSYSHRVFVTKDVAELLEELMNNV